MKEVGNQNRHGWAGREVGGWGLRLRAMEDKIVKPGNVEVRTPKNLPPFTTLNKAYFLKRIRGNYRKAEAINRKTLGHV